MHGVDNFGAPSRFIAEVPLQLVEEVRPKVQVSRPVYSPQSRPTTQATRPTGSNLSMSGRRFQDETPPGGLKLGQRVRHAKFGDGVILSLEGQGSHARVQVNFERQGTKWLMLGYANLDAV